MENEKDFETLKVGDEVEVILSVPLLEKEVSIILGKVTWNSQETKEVNVTTQRGDIAINYEQIKSIKIF